ncbi:MAG: VOC family protein [Alphaproteobacteria bacterium]
MEQRLSLVTLGVRDIAKARKFYEALGWKTGGPTNPHVAFFQLGGVIIGLWSKESLAEEAGLNLGKDFGGVALAQNVADKKTVDRVLAEAEKAGGKIIAAASDKFWGGYSGYFTDIDGHPWEIAWNPGFTLTADGKTLLEG